MPKKRGNGQGSIYWRKDGLATACKTINGKKLFAYGKTPEIAWSKLEEKAGIPLGSMPAIVATDKTAVTTNTEERFYQIPKALFDSKYKLSSDAKLLYGLLLDKGGGEVSREELREVLGVGRNTMTKLFAELKQYGLIEEVRQGSGKANRIYLTDLIPKK
jgi:biotin operon repressor